MPAASRRRLPSGAFGTARGSATASDAADATVQTAVYHGSISALWPLRAKAAEELAPRGVSVTFGPVLVSKSLRTHKRNELRGAAVRFRKQRERVRRLACGDLLTEAIESS